MEIIRIKSKVDNFANNKSNTKVVSVRRVRRRGVEENNQHGIEDAVLDSTRNRPFQQEVQIGGESPCINCLSK